MIMKYQEQIQGVTRGMMAEAPAGDPNAQNPQIIEMVMAQAAQQVMQANQAAAQAGPTPEQAMVQMEAQRLDIEQQKVQAQLAKEAVEGALKQRDLDLKEQKLSLDAYKIGAENTLKADEKEADRNNKRAIEALKLIADLIKTQEQLDQTEAMKGVDVLTKVLMEGAKQSGSQ